MSLSDICISQAHLTVAIVGGGGQNDRPADVKVTEGELESTDRYSGK